MPNAQIEGLRAVSEDYFRDYGGSVMDVAVNERPVEDGSADSPTEAVVTVAFENRDLFGAAGADIFDEVYHRYRALRGPWWDALRDMGPQPHLLPLAAANARAGDPLPLRVPLSGTISLVRLDSLPANAYLDRMRELYSLDYAIIGNSGRMFDLDEGLLMAVDVAAVKMKDIGVFVDLGSGTGSASKIMLTRADVTQVLANDFSEDSGEHLRNYLGAIVAEKEAGKGASVRVAVGDCRDLEFPRDVGCMAVSVAFGLQPSLLGRRGAAIKAALGTGGVLIAASSMTGMPFYQSLVEGSDARLKNWPWYSSRNSLRHYFAAVRSVRVRNLVVTIASDSADRVARLICAMAARGAVPSEARPSEARPSGALPAGARHS